MTLRFQNAQFWRPLIKGGSLSFASNMPTAAKTIVKATTPVTIFLRSFTGDGEVGDPILVGMVQPGDTPVAVSHGVGFILEFDFQAGKPVSVFDDREETSADAPVGESFTRFEKQGIAADDPLQILIHRDEVRKRLERMAGEQVGDPNAALVTDLQDQVASLTRLIQERFPENDPEISEPAPTE